MFLHLQDQHTAAVSPSHTTFVIPSLPNQAWHSPAAGKQPIASSQQESKVNTASASCDNLHMQTKEAYQQQGLASPLATPGGFSIAPPFESPFSTHRPPIASPLQRHALAGRHDHSAGPMHVTPHAPRAMQLTGSAAACYEAKPVLSPFMQRVARQMQRDAAMLAADAQQSQHSARADNLGHQQVSFAGSSPMLEA